MRFSVEISKTAEKDLNSLDKKTCQIILKKIHKISEDPIHYIERLIGYTLYKIRCGDYRLIVRIDTTNKVIQIIMINHRKRIYKRLEREF